MWVTFKSFLHGSLQGRLGVLTLPLGPIVLRSLKMFSDLNILIWMLLNKNIVLQSPRATLPVASRDSTVLWSCASRGNSLGKMKSESWNAIAKQQWHALTYWACYRYQWHMDVWSLQASPRVYLPFWWGPGSRCIWGGPSTSYREY